MRTETQAARPATRMMTVVASNDSQQPGACRSSPPACSRQRCSLVDMMAAAAAPVEPVIVYTGPTKTGADLIAANAVEPKPGRRRSPSGKKGSKTAAKKPDAAADTKDAKARSIRPTAEAGRASLRPNLRCQTGSGANRMQPRRNRPLRPSQPPPSRARLPSLPRQPAAAPATTPAKPEGSEPNPHGERLPPAKAQAGCRQLRCT